MQVQTQAPMSVMRDWYRLGGQLIFTLAVLYSIGHYLVHMLATPF